MANVKEYLGCKSGARVKVKRKKKIKEQEGERKWREWGDSRWRTTNDSKALDLTISNVVYKKRRECTWSSLCELLYIWFLEKYLVSWPTYLCLYIKNVIWCNDADTQNHEVAHHVVNSRKYSWKSYLNWKSYNCLLVFPTKLQHFNPRKYD